MRKIFFISDSDMEKLNIIGDHILVERNYSQTIRLVIRFAWFHLKSFIRFARHEGKQRAEVADVQSETSQEPDKGV